MASAHQNLSTYDEASIPNGKEFKIGIVVSEWNSEITHALYSGCYDTLLKHEVDPERIYTIQVPGSFELPAGGKMIYSKHNPDAIVCLGCVIQGETRHNEYINQSVATGLTNLSIASGTPFIFGVLTPNTLEQARERAGGVHGNKGIEAAVTALRMAGLKQKMSKAEKRIGFSNRIS